MTPNPTSVEVFGVGPDGVLIPLSPGSSPPEERVAADRVWTPVASDRPAERTHVGHRLGGYNDRPARGGGREDVVAPVHVLPGVASRALHSGHLFSEPLPGVTVDVASLVVGSHGSTWNATVRCRRFGFRRRRNRRATLRAYPSPSANLTVLELVPTRRRLVQTRNFVDVGVPAIATLSTRIAKASRAGAWAIATDPI